MLHSCDAGEYSVVTTYVGRYDLHVNSNDNSTRVEFNKPQMHAMFVVALTENSFPGN